MTGISQEYGGIEMHAVSEAEKSYWKKLSELLNAVGQSDSERLILCYEILHSEVEKLGARIDVLERSTRGSDVSLE